MMWYFGSPSPGRRGFWMLDGGPGYILFWEAVRRLVEIDFNDNDDGAFAASAHLSVLQFLSVSETI
jgi:hypothetical protein